MHSCDNKPNFFEQNTTPKLPLKFEKLELCFTDFHWSQTIFVYLQCNFPTQHSAFLHLILIYVSIYIFIEYILLMCLFILYENVELFIHIHAIYCITFLLYYTFPRFNRHLPHYSTSNWIINVITKFRVVYETMKFVVYTNKQTNAMKNRLNVFCFVFSLYTTDVCKYNNKRKLNSDEFMFVYYKWLHKFHSFHISQATMIIIIITS